MPEKQYHDQMGVELLYAGFETCFGKVLGAKQTSNPVFAPFLNGAKKTSGSDVYHLRLTDRGNKRGTDVVHFFHGCVDVIFARANSIARFLWPAAIGHSKRAHPQFS